MRRLAIILALGLLGNSPPLKFADGRDEPVLLNAIAQSLEDAQTFAGHFAIGYAGSGASSWLVDRETGVVIAVPEDPEGKHSTLMVIGHLNEPVISVTYDYAREGDGDCRTQDYEWANGQFRMRGPRQFGVCASASAD